MEHFSKQSTKCFTERNESNTKTRKKQNKRIYFTKRGDFKRRILSDRLIFLGRPFQSLGALMVKDLTPFSVQPGLCKRQNFM